jgi:hypothetical protein
MAQYAQALLLKSDYPEALDRLSWILATDPRPEFRNGTEAVRMATSACELTGYKDPGMILTLAAAFAETGSFSEAERLVELAIRVSKDSGPTNDLHHSELMQRQFRGKLPWRDGPTPPD